MFAEWRRLSYDYIKGNPFSGKNFFDWRTDIHFLQFCGFFAQNFDMNCRHGDFLFGFVDQKAFYLLFFDLIFFVFMAGNILKFQTFANDNGIGSHCRIETFSPRKFANNVIAE